MVCKCEPKNKKNKKNDNNIHLKFKKKTTQKIIINIMTKMQINYFYDLKQCFN